MPYASKAQAAYFNANRDKLEKQGVDVDEWNHSTNFSALPETKSMAGDKWMQDESEREKSAGTKGVFSSAAAHAGKSTREFAEEHKHDSGPKGSKEAKRGNRARMALAYMGANKG
jgi:hypothetical protein